MSYNQNTTGEPWDTRIIDFIEETPEIKPKQLNEFRKHVRIYVMRGVPSWKMTQPVPKIHDTVPKPRPVAAAS